MAGTNLSFVAPPSIAQRMQEIARADEITTSQAVARAVVLGAMLPASSRHLVRFIVAEGDAEAQAKLRDTITKAIALVGNMVLEERLRANAVKQDGDRPVPSDDEIEAQATRAVNEYLRDKASVVEPPFEVQKTGGR